MRKVDLEWISFTGEKISKTTSQVNFIMCKNIHIQMDVREKKSRDLASYFSMPYRKIAEYVDLYHKSMSHISKTTTVQAHILNISASAKR